jgi:hydroxymethylpyrimidine/phosphomethylpyrimidine kinase
LRNAGVEMLVVDPVLAASTGHPLLDEPGIDALVRMLLPRATVVTPNVAEAERLSGRAVRTVDDAAEAARAIGKLGPSAVVVTGGHLDGDPVDVLFDGSYVIVIPGKRIETRNLHGTGCVFSAAVTAGLAKGRGIEAAVLAAKEFVTGAIERGSKPGKGRGSVDPAWRSGLA